MTKLTLTGVLNKIPDVGRNYLLILGWNPGGLCYVSSYISSADSSYTLTIDFQEPISGSEVPGICILNIDGADYTIIPVKFQEEISTNPA